MCSTDPEASLPVDRDAGAGSEEATTPARKPAETPAEKEKNTQKVETPTGNREKLQQDINAAQAPSQAPTEEPAPNKTTQNEDETTQSEAEAPTVNAVGEPDAGPPRALELGEQAGTEQAAEPTETVSEEPAESPLGA